MNVGVLTCHSSLNYGANLQLYATVHRLEEMGHTVFVYDNRESEESPCRNFVTHHFKLTQLCHTDDDFRAETIRLGIDVIVVGSDAVLWFNPSDNRGKGAYPNPFWLRWARDLPVRKAIVAGSCMGLMYFKCSKAVKAQLREDFAAFDYICVRDRWTQAFVRWAGSAADLTFDPTSCLPGALGDREVEGLPHDLEYQKYLMLTFTYPDEAWITALSRLAADQGLKTCFIRHPDRTVDTYYGDVIIDEILDPLAWLNLLRGSVGYVGERFHPVVLSSFFSVPFISCDYYSRSGFWGMVSRKRSKTVDFCNRVGGASSVYPADSFYRQVSPATVLEHLNKQPSTLSDGYKHSFVTCLERAVSG